MNKEPKRQKKDPNLEILSAFLNKTLKEKQIRNLVLHLNQHNRNKILSNLVNLAYIDLMDLVDPEKFQKLMGTISEIESKLNLNVGKSLQYDEFQNAPAPAIEVEETEVAHDNKLEKSALYALTELGYIGKKELSEAYKQLQLLRGD